MPVSALAWGCPITTRHLRKRQQTPAVSSPTRSPTARSLDTRLKSNRTRPVVTGSGSCLSSGCRPSSPHVAPSPSTSPSRTIWARWCTEVSILCVFWLFLLLFLRSSFHGSSTPVFRETIAYVTVCNCRASWAATFHSLRELFCCLYSLSLSLSLSLSPVSYTHLTLPTRRTV